MTYYSIDIIGYKLAGCKTVQELVCLRKENMKITNNFWLTIGLDFELAYNEPFYPKQTAVIIFLN
jgi:hypothetical protein